MEKELLSPLWQAGILGVLLALSLTVNGYLFRMLMRTTEDRLSEAKDRLDAYYKLANEWALLLRELQNCVNLLLKDR